MQLEGTHKIKVGQHKLWDLLNDPDVLARATPGVKELILVSEDTYDAIFHIKMGPINSMFKGKLEVVDKVEPQGYKLLVDVDAKIGVVSAEASIQLNKDGLGTEVAFKGRGKLSGKMARMGQRVLSGVARMFTRRFFEALENEVPEEIVGGAVMEIPVKMKVNGQDYERRVEPRTLLVNYIRDHLGLTGTHVGCDTSGCGSCTIMVNGQAVKSCTMLAMQAQGAEITTIEGLEGPDGQLHPLQEGFREMHGLQCGFCTPGMIMASVELLERNPQPEDAEIRHALEGNFCRCTGYENIVRAVRHAAGKSE